MIFFSWSWSIMEITKMPKSSETLFSPDLRTSTWGHLIILELKLCTSSQLPTRRWDNSHKLELSCLTLTKQHAWEKILLDKLPSQTLFWGLTSHRTCTSKLVNSSSRQTSLRMFQIISTQDICTTSEESRLFNLSILSLKPDLFRP